MTMRSGLGVLVVLLLVAGLACSPGYRRESLFIGGYSESRVLGQEYLVEYRGNGFTGAAEAERFVYRRAAELAMEKGFSHFAVVSCESFYRTRVEVVEDSAGSRAAPSDFAPEAGPIVREYHPNTTPVTYTASSKKGVAVMRVVLTNEPDSVPGRVMEAKAVWEDTGR